jgi:ABC-type multidrug transport system fused ATPase/permease subunit
MLSWRYHPAAKDKTKTLLAASIIVVFGVFVLWYSQSALFALLAALILTASLGVFFFPTRYTLSEEELTVEFLGTKQIKKWGSFVRAEPEKNGVFLSPFARKNFLEHYRGVFVRYAGNKKEVDAFVLERLKNGTENKG